MDESISDNRWYGVRYHESVGEDLYRVAGRILSDLKTDQHEGRMPKEAVLMVAIMDHHMIVQVHLQSDMVRENWGSETIRARVYTVMARYNWKGRRNRADVRYTTVCKVRTVRDRLDALTLGAIIG
ncbi:hypothetical protein EV192_101717 [Actinocrispum wychmicini]|uniref:Transposase IS200 family protein n=1 Tax=Actinocrispum wychmicini TaxID=1213861 RepID=A0A4R2JWT4_9PSEU|nr:hypothetical protein EV192_101717 [Actinocrispum wychmicini]